MPSVASNLTWNSTRRVVCACVAFWFAACAASGATFTASLDRNTVPVGESVMLSLTYGGGGNPETPQLPAIPNVTATGSGQSSQLSFANGQQSMQVTYTYQLTATQPGDVVIPAIRGRVDGVPVTTQPLALKIIKSDAASSSYTNLAFVKLIVPKTEIYLGEPIPIEMQLYWQERARDVHVPQLKADGFAIGQMPRPGQTRTQIGNAIYNLVICKHTVTATRTGTLLLGPAETTLTLVVPIPGQPQRDFFGNMMGQPRQVTVTSETASLRVLPLPADNVPPGFSGAIGTYRMAVTAGPTNLTVGDPITVHVQLTGNGPIESLQLPAQTDWRDFNTYPPTSKADIQDPLGLAGTKSFEQVVIPQNHEITALPPMRFSFFDPQAKAYRTLSGPSIPLTIRPATAGAAPPPVLTNTASGATPPPADDIVHIRPHLEALATAAPLLVSRPWFLGLQAAPVLLWLSLLARRRRAEALANNPRLRRQREVAARIRELLKELRASAASQQSPEFFATLFRVLQEQLGERLDLPASAITEAVLDERLRSRGLPEEAMRSLHELFQTCNAARYAPTHSIQELSALIPKVESALRPLQQLKA